MRILIAEDDLASRIMLAAVLKKVGYEVVETVNGAEAWRALQQPDTPALAILDWMMPEMDGLEVVRRVRALQTDRPPYIIMLTGKGDKADIVAGLEAGANDYVVKPYDNEELWARVRVGERMVDLQAKLSAARNALMHEALHDPLTGVLNRRAILEILEKEIARAKRNNGALSIGLCDIDYFKRINDSYGHQAGDEALCAFVRCVQSHLREYDFFGRYGGEEFLVVSTGAAGAGAGGPYERLRAAAAANCILIKGGAISLTVSVGVSGWAGEESIDPMLAAADAALYQAKNEGRDRVVYAEMTRARLRI